MIHLIAYFFIQCLLFVTVGFTNKRRYIPSKHLSRQRGFLGQLEIISPIACGRMRRGQRTWEIRILHSNGGRFTMVYLYNLAIEAAKQLQNDDKAENMYLCMCGAWHSWDIMGRAHMFAFAGQWCFHPLYPTSSQSHRLQNRCVAFEVLVAVAGSNRSTPAQSIATRVRQHTLVRCQGLTRPLNCPICNAQCPTLPSQLSNWPRP